MLASVVDCEKNGSRADHLLVGGVQTSEQKDLVGRQSEAANVADRARKCNIDHFPRLGCAFQLNGRKSQSFNGVKRLFVLVQPSKCVHILVHFAD